VACVEFYEPGFGVPSHRFLRSLLQFYGLELHHLSSSGILHMAAFVILYKAYMRIEPHFNLWNYFFHAWLQQGSGVEEAVLGSVDIFVQSGPEVDPYFGFPLSDPLVGWWNVWFFLRNSADMQLPVDVLYPAPQVHGIVIVAVHWEYSPGIVFIFSLGRKYLYHV
jgi:hypothetical protein